MKSQEQHACSFCGKLESETLRVFTGPGKQTSICEECLTFSQNILSDPAPSEQMEGSCSFCGKTSSQVERLVYGPGTNICNHCIDFARQQFEDDNTTTRTALGSSPWRGLGSKLRKLLSRGRADYSMTEKVKIR
jgi:ATP-dependent protease Clp ATPase subunit